MEIIAKCPKFRMPKNVHAPKGRAVTAEEFDRMLDKVEAVVGSVAAPDWKFLLRGLWWSGLRRSEAWNLHWTDRSRMTIDYSGRNLQFEIDASISKNGKSELFPMAPEFAAMLESIPVEQRTGFVFNPSYKNGRGRVIGERMSRLIGQIGAKAVVAVGTKPKKKKTQTEISSTEWFRSTLRVTISDAHSVHGGHQGQASRQPTSNASCDTHRSRRRSNTTPPGMLIRSLIA